MISGVENPRTGNSRRHDLLEVLFLSLCASFRGAESCVDMAEFAEAKEEVLRGFLKLERGPPSHDTFSRKPDGMTVSSQRSAPRSPNAIALAALELPMEPGTL